MSYDILPKAKLQYLLTRLKEVFDGMVQGHTIKNNTGTSMTTRTSVQFGGYLKTTDDATNDRTIIDDSPIEITWAEYQALTDVQRANNKYLITDYPGGGGGSSGHTILNPYGIEMTQENKLQFIGNLSVSDDNTDGKTVVSIHNIDRTFNVAVADWVANSGSTSTDYPYIAEINTAYYNANSKPIWQMNGSSAIPTSTEREDINLVLEAIFDTTGITLYATDIPSGALVLEVKGE